MCSRPKPRRTNGKRTLVPRTEIVIRHFLLLSYSMHRWIIMINNNNNHRRLRHGNILAPRPSPREYSALGTRPIFFSTPRRAARQCSEIFRSCRRNASEIPYGKRVKKNMRKIWKAFAARGRTKFINNEFRTTHCSPAEMTYLITLCCAVIFIVSLICQAAFRCCCCDVANRGCFELAEHSNWRLECV